VNLEGLGRKPTCPILKTSRHLPGGTEEEHEKLVKILGVPDISE
jgi:hypothetical protein